MLEVLGYALNWKGFLIESLIPDLMAPPGNSLESNWFFPHAPCSMPHAFLASLPDPSGLPVTGRPYQNVLRELPK